MHTGCLQEHAVLQRSTIKTLTDLETDMPGSDLCPTAAGGPRPRHPPPTTNPALGGLALHTPPAPKTQDLKLAATTAAAVTQDCKGLRWQKINE